MAIAEGPHSKAGAMMAEQETFPDTESAVDPARQVEQTNRAEMPERERAYFEHLRSIKSKTVPTFGLFSNKDVFIVPGFMGSELRDGSLGLIWINPLDLSKLAMLKLAQYEEGQPDHDASAGVAIQPDDPPPLIYTNLHWKLELNRCQTTYFPVDWRKNLEESAERLANQLVARSNANQRPIYVVAHSQGALVARRAIEILGQDVARQVVKHLVMIGPANRGTFSALFAIAGSHESIEMAKKYFLNPPPEFITALQSMNGVYQLLPLKPDDPNILPYLRDNDISQVAYWQRFNIAVDATRLAKFYGWARRIKTDFFSDRMTIILGDQKTAGGAKLGKNRAGQDVLVPDEQFNVSGDGTVPDVLAILSHVRTYRAEGASHMWMGMNPDVVEAVAAVIVDRAITADVVESGGMGFADRGLVSIRRIKKWQPPTPLRQGPDAPETVEAAPTRLPDCGAAPTGPGGAASAGSGTASGAVAIPKRAVVPIPITPPEPSHRRLKVFSFDPILARQLQTLKIDAITLHLPWTEGEGSHLQPGPVGDYLEVIDYDPVSQCFYPPVDLNHPNWLAQDGVPISEGNPQFHQQMVYAVAMQTIRHFECALGRVAMWAPRRVENSGPEGTLKRIDTHYVPRLRLYPHAMLQANAYYDPGKIAILFGYFTAEFTPQIKNVGREFIFSALCYDIIAHETTHALLDGLHRYFQVPSNPDVLAFHEAFADIVALFQHFTHPEVLSDQIAAAGGDLRHQNLLGSLAVQFGMAMRHGGALRDYIGTWVDGKWTPIEPDPTKIENTTEAHDRGAILVAALFRAFLSMYDNRTADLKRIATAYQGNWANGELRGDFVRRFADEAATAARDLLHMAIRALDYVPPADITFGEYLRALITADFDLRENDERRYRVAVLEAFRDWGILPRGVRTLSIDSLLWRSPAADEVRDLSAIVTKLDIERWDRRINREQVFDLLQQNQAKFHDMLEERLTDADFKSLGIYHGPGLHSIRRSQGGQGQTAAFQVHSVRPSRRVGLDGDVRLDLIVELVQTRNCYFDPQKQKAVDAGTLVEDLEHPDFKIHGGSTLIVDPRTGLIRYCIRKPVPLDPTPASGNASGNSITRADYQAQLQQQTNRLTNLYGNNPFAMLHAQS